MSTEGETQPPELTLESVSQVARAVTLQHGHHVPTLITVGSKETLVAQLPDFEDTHEGRVQQMTAIGVAVAQDADIGLLERVFFISEAWMSLAKDGKLPEILPSQDPARKEVLVVSSLDIAAREPDMVLFEMIRNNKGKLKRLTEVAPANEEGRQVESPLLSAFVYGYAMGLARPND